jgi:hypothetical protein
MSNPFTKPAAASGIQWEQLLGKLLLIEPKSLERDVQTVHGAKDAVRADVTVLDEAPGPEEYPDALIFPSVLITQVRSAIGEQVLGRLAQGVPKVGQKPPWRLNDATDEDINAGVAYLKSRTEGNPFTAPAQAEAKAPWE